MIEIETSRATIDTLSVTIKALHVSGKQMTLAVFRQLPEKKEPPGTSELWGVVRYAIANEGYMWLVFSHNDRLYRRSMHPKADYYIMSSKHNSADSKANEQARADKDNQLVESLPQLFIAT